MATKIGHFISPYEGGVKTVTINNPGSGYAIADEVTVVAGNNDFYVQIHDVDGSGAVTDIGIKYYPGSGTGYSDASNVATSGGSGDQLFTVDITVWDSSNTVTLTGFGFKPKAMFFFGLNAALTNGYGGSSNGCYHMRGAWTDNGQFSHIVEGTNKTGPWTFSKTANNCILMDGSGFGTVLRGNVTSTNDDGCVITFDTVTSGSCYSICYLAFGGDQLGLCKTKEFSIPLYSSGSTANIDLDQNIDLGIVVGAGYSSGEESQVGVPNFGTSVIATRSDSQARGQTNGNISSCWGPNRHARGLANNTFCRLHANTVINSQSTYRGWIPEGINLQIASTTTMLYYMNMLEMSGMEARLISITTPTGGAQDVTYTTMGFQAEGLLFLSRQSTAAPGITAISGFLHGISDGTTNYCETLTSRRFTVFGVTVDVCNVDMFGPTNANDPAFSAVPGWCIYQQISGSGLTCSGYCTGITSNGFTIHYETASTASPVLVLGWKMKDDVGAIAHPGQHWWEYQRTDSDTLWHFKMSDAASPLTDSSSNSNNIDVFTQPNLLWRQDAPRKMDASIKLADVCTILDTLDHTFSVSAGESIIELFVFKYPEALSLDTGYIYLFSVAQEGSGSPILVQMWYAIDGVNHVLLIVAGDDAGAHTGYYMYDSVRPANFGQGWNQLAIVYDKTKSIPVVYLNNEEHTGEILFGTNPFSDFGSMTFTQSIGSFQLDYISGLYPTIHPVQFAEWWASKGTKFKKMP